MGERIDIDGVRFKVDADLSKLKDGLKEGEKLGKESGQKTATTFSQAFNAVAGAAVAASLKGFFTNAANEFKKVESAMLRVDSIAKGFGRSVTEARSQVEQLANKGFLNLTQSAESYANAIALGFDEKQARSFIDALSDIAAFQNTIGNGAEAVTSGLAGLLSNSAEKVENIGVPVKVLNQEYQKNVEKLGKAAALQKFYNGILAESSKFAGDAAKATETLTGAQSKFEAATQKTMAAVGKGLEPALKSLYAIGTQVVTWLGEIVQKLDSTTVAAVAFGSVGFAGIAAFAKGAALLPGVFGSIGASITAALGPIGLFIAGISAAVVIVSKLRREWGESQTRTMLGERDALIQQIGALQNATGRTKELAEAKARLAEINKQITANYAQYLKYLDAENLSIERKIALVDALEKAEKRLSMDKDLRDRSVDELKAKSKELEGEIAKGARLLASGAISRERYDEELGKVVAEKALVDATLETKTGGGPKPIVPTGGKASPEFRFIAARDQLRELQREYEAYLKKVGPDSALGKQATERLGIEQQAITKQLRGAIAEYIEDRYTAEKLAIDAQRDEQIKNVRELVNAKAISEKEAEKKIQEIREANVRKTAQIQAESFARTMQGASMIASGAAGLINARDAGGALGGIGGIAQGFGGLSDRFKALGSIGQGLGAAGAIVSVLGGLFGKSDAERAREAEQQKRRDEEAKALLELQAGYQRSMLALQEAQAKLPFENLTRELRLIDIKAQEQRVSGGDEATIEQQRLAARQGAIQNVLQSQADVIGGGALFAGTGATPEAITQFLSNSAALKNQLSPLFALAAQSGQVTDQAMLSLLIPELQRLGYSPTATSYGYDFGNALTDETDKGKLVRAAIQQIFGGRYGFKPLDVLSSELTRDISTAESLLSVIEDQLRTQQDIAKNTKVTADKLSETPTRQSSIIDIARGYTRSLGTVLNPSLTNIGLPQSIAAAVLATDIQKTLQERQVKGIEDLVIIQRDSRELLAIIGKSLNSGTNANSALLVQLEDLYRRSLAA